MFVYGLGRILYGAPNAISGSLCLCLHSDVSWPPTNQDQKRAHSLQRLVTVSQEPKSHALQREVPLQLQVCGDAGVLLLLQYRQRCFDHVLFYFQCL